MTDLRDLLKRAQDEIRWELNVLISSYRGWIEGDRWQTDEEVLADTDHDDVDETTYERMRHCKTVIDEIDQALPIISAPAVVDADGRMSAPEHGWACYHCGEHFPGTHRGWQAAGYHFGWTPDKQPACRIAEEEGGLPKRLRIYEDGQERDKKTISTLEAEVARLREAMANHGRGPVMDNSRMEAAQRARRMKERKAKDQAS